MPDDLAATLTGAKRIADGLQFACMMPGKTPDFSFCGGPAAEAYWNYFTPARISSLLAALEAVLKLADSWKQFAVSGDAQDECADELRETIRVQLEGGE